MGMGVPLSATVVPGVRGTTDGLDQRQTAGRVTGVRVLVVDDHDVVHLGFRLLLTSQDWIERCVAAHDATEAVTLARRYEPHVVIVDLSVGQGSGPQVAEAVRTAIPSTRLILLSSAGHLSVSAAKRLGSSAMLPKRARAHDIARVVRHVAAGGRHFPQVGVESSRLSDRECEVLTLLANGRTNREIAAKLHLAPDTVKNHAAAIYRKLGVRNRTEAARRGDELGLLVADHGASALAVA
jgi:DNA-binding NarL/FixJ family response regulator